MSAIASAAAAPVSAAAAYAAAIATEDRIQELLTSQDFTQEMFEELKYLGNYRTSYDWGAVLDMDEISLSTLECLVENNVFSLQASNGADSIFNVIIAKQEISMDGRIRVMSRLLEKGADINEQCPLSGASVLADYIEWLDTPIEYHEDAAYRLSMLNDAIRIIPFLLENGADPLLEDKEGVSPMSRHAEPYYIITDELKTFLGDEMRKVL